MKNYCIEQVEAEEYVGGSLTGDCHTESDGWKHLLVMYELSWMGPRYAIQN